MQDKLDKGRKLSPVGRQLPEDMRDMQEPAELPWLVLEEVSHPSLPPGSIRSLPRSIPIQQSLPELLKNFVS